MKLTTVILDYKKAERVLDAVDSLMGQKISFDHEIIVVDNSVDKKNAEILSSLKKHKNLKLIINDENIGYSRAYNQAISGIENTDYLLILNPDIIFEDPDSISKMLGYLDKNPQVGIIGPKQLNDDGTLAITVRSFPKLYVQIARRTFLRHLPFLKSAVSHDELQDIDLNQIQEVDWIQSSCFIIRKDLWDDLQGFNEDYFLFMADTEICLEAHKKNKLVIYYPEVQVRADGLRCSRGGFLAFFTNPALRIHFFDSIRYMLNN